MAGQAKITVKWSWGTIFFAFGIGDLRGLVALHKQKDHASVTHDSPLIALLAVGFGLAFVLGAIASRLKLSPLIGYLLAGVLIGPATPGFVADEGLAQEVADQTHGETRDMAQRWLKDRS